MHIPCGFFSKMKGVPLLAWHEGIRVKGKMDKSNSSVNTRQGEDRQNWRVFWFGHDVNGLRNEIEPKLSRNRSFRDVSLPDRHFNGPKIDEID